MSAIFLIHSTFLTKVWWIIIKILSLQPPNTLLNILYNLVKVYYQYDFIRNFATDLEIKL